MFVFSNNHLMKVFKYLLILVVLSSCTIEQDYFFEKNGKVDMDVNIDMSRLFQSIPSGGPTDLANIQDSIDANSDIKDSLKLYGISDFTMNFDTNTYKMLIGMSFKDMKSLNKFMNKDREESQKPIEVAFSKTNFSVKNCASLISNDVLEGLNKNKEGSEDNPEMDMSKFFTFKTTYHFPYEVKEFKSASGKGNLKEDKKSISFDNTLDEFTDDTYNGDLDVTFK